MLSVTIHLNIPGRHDKQCLGLDNMLFVTIHLNIQAGMTSNV